MPRKVDVAKIKEDFVESLDSLDEAVVEAMNSEINRPTRELIFEGLLLSAAVGWERFISELFAGYINRDGSKMSSDLLARIQNSTKDKLGELVSKHVKLDMPKNLRVAQVQELLDRDERNLTFNASAKIVEYAKRVLRTDVAEKFEDLDVQAWATIDAIHAMRNYVAHRSSSAKKEMNRLLHSSHLPGHLRRGKHSIGALGSFLDSVPNKPLVPGTPRLASFIQSLIVIAKEL